MKSKGTTQQVDKVKLYIPSQDSLIGFRLRASFLGCSGAGDGSRCFPTELARRLVWLVPTCINLYQLHNRMTIFIETIKFNICSNQQNVLILIYAREFRSLFFEVKPNAVGRHRNVFHGNWKKLIDRNKSCILLLPWGWGTH